MLSGMAASLRASVIVIGDEVLGGFVQDTNSGWIARRLQVHGVALDRVVTVPDEHDAIGEALGAELRRARPRVLFTTGGIGSTPDDLTMEAVARHLDVPVTALPAIEARIDAAIARSSAEGVPLTAEDERSLRRMALAPRGAYLVPSPDHPSAAVAVDLDGGSRAGGATVVILPGVPDFVRRSLDEGVEDVLLAGRGSPAHVAELRHPYPESVLNPVLGRLVDEYPDLHVGSYPGRECTIRLKGEVARVEEAMALVRSYLDDVEARPAADRMRERWRRAWS
jgi:nicotinamide-nucleotide amidase